MPNSISTRRAAARPAPAHPPAVLAPAPTPELDLVRPVAQHARRGPYAILRVSEPGRAFSPEVKRRLMKAIERESVPLLEGIDIRVSYWQRRADYFDRIDEWIIVEHDGRLVAWCGLCKWQSDTGPILYFDTLGVMPGHRRTGIGALLTMESWFRFWRFPRRMPCLALRSQSPVVYALFRRLIPRICYPQVAHPDRKLPRRAVEVLTTAVQRTSPDKRFDPQTCVVFGAVSAGALYGDSLPSSGDQMVDAFFAEHLDVSAGDSLMGVGVPHIKAYVPGMSWAIAVYFFFRLRVARSRPQTKVAPPSSDPSPST